MYFILNPTHCSVVLSSDLRTHLDEHPTSSQPHMSSSSMTHTLL